MATTIEDTSIEQEHRWELPPIPLTKVNESQIITLYHQPLKAYKGNFYFRANEKFLFNSEAGTSYGLGTKFEKARFCFKQDENPIAKEKFSLIRSAMFKAVFDEHGSKLKMDPSMLKQAANIENLSIGIPNKGTVYFSGDTKTPIAFSKKEASSICPAGTKISAVIDVLAILDTTEHVFQVYFETSAFRIVEKGEDKGYWHRWNALFPIGGND